MPSVILRPTQPWGNVVQLGNKTYPGPLTRRRGGDPLWQLAGSTPAVDFNFSSGSMLDQVSGQDLITFTRTSTAWGWDGSAFVEFANDVPRIVVDPATGLRGLLVEESRTNLLLNSDTLSTQTVTVTASQRTLSFYGTGTVTLSGASTAGPLVGTGAAPSRVSLTFTPTSGSLTLTVSGSVRFAQLELGAFPTSPIITTGSALTRSADLASVTGANFSSWFNASGMTFYGDSYCESVVPSGDFRIIASVNDGTQANRIRLAYITSVIGGLVVTSANVGQVGAYPAVTEFRRKIAGAAFTDDAAAVVNGSAPSIDSAVIMPVGLNILRLGANETLSRLGFLNGIIPRLAIWPTRLPNATLQALTA